MRIRTIKPEFWLNERIAKLSEKTQLVAIALLNYADDEGYFYANPDVIRGQLFPFHEDSRRITVALTELSKLDYLRIAKSEDGRDYGFIVNFKNHQRVSNATPSKLKGLASFTESSRSPHVVLTEPSLLEGKGMEEEMEVEEESVPLPFLSQAFGLAWDDFKKHRKEIRKKLTPTATKQTLVDLAAIGEQRAIAAIRHTIGKGWQGIREPEAQRSFGNQFARPELNGAQMR